MKKWLCRITMLISLMGLCACSDEDWEEEDYEEDDTAVSSEAQPEESSGADTEAVDRSGGRSTSMSVDRKSGKMTITRRSYAGTPMASDGSWTIMVYLCGTDLESGGSGMATMDMQEMIEGTESGSVRYVVETGGTEDWDNDVVQTGETGRYVIENGDISKEWSGSNDNMGTAGTLSDFLAWGIGNYPSEHMGLIFWDHGSGSINGVCFDELHDSDSISLREIDEAFTSVAGNMSDRFDFIGFDACLMGTVEAANVLAPYAYYMYGSEEVEPGYGWDYKAMGDAIAEGSAKDGASLGKVVSDSFYAMCEEIDSEDEATMAVVDLDALDDLLTSFNNFAKDMYEAGNDANMLAAMVRGIEGADNFGGNNKSEGYTNMVDLAGLVSACSDYSSNAGSVLSALDKCISYKINGSDHKNAGGLAIYYPLSVQGSAELKLFSEVCVSPYYLSFVDRQGQGSVGNFSDYDESSWFEDDEWYWGEEEDDGYWDYIDEFEQTGESPLISFAVEPFLDDDGSFWFQLDDDGYYYAADVYAYVYQISPDEEDIIELGTTYDIYADWDEGVFSDEFDGYWLSLPDGQNLATYIVEMTDEYIVYTSPIELNGEETNLRLRQYFDGTVVVDGVWDGIDENGMADRNVTMLKDGDVIIPMYYAYSLEDEDNEFYYYGGEYRISGEIRINYDFMDDGDYLYAFCIDDIYGDYYLTDFAAFNVEDGEVSFYAE